jgi:hypothetical protein
MNTVKRRKLEYLWHIMRNDTNYKILKSILQGERTRRKKDIKVQEPEYMVFAKTTAVLSRARS